jgi:hypothetical protein
MNILWIALAVLGGCLVGILEMCLLIANQGLNDEVAHMLKDA